MSWLAMKMYLLAIGLEGARKLDATHFHDLTGIASCMPAMPEYLP